MVLARPGVRLTTKIDSKNSLYSLSHFTEYLVGVFRKLPRKNNLDHKSSSLLIRWLKSTTGTSSYNNPQTTRVKIPTKNQTPAPLSPVAEHEEWRQDSSAAWETSARHAGQAGTETSAQQRRPGLEEETCRARQKQNR
jgi:hypothetical protein